MRLYTLTGATAVDDSEHGHFPAGPDGAFDLPDQLAAQLHRTHVAGKPQWETADERQTRLDRAQIDALKNDPDALQAAITRLTATPA